MLRVHVRNANPQISIVSVTKWLKRSGNRSNFRYELDLHDENTIVCTNARSLRIVLEHLLENANKFTQQGSIVLSCNISGGRLRISVTDIGEGISIESEKPSSNVWYSTTCLKKGSAPNPWPFWGEDIPQLEICVKKITTKCVESTKYCYIGGRNILKSDCLWRNKRIER